MCPVDAESRAEDWTIVRASNRRWRTLRIPHSGILRMNENQSTATEGGSLDAGAGLVGPFELDGEVAEAAGFPGADVADFAVRVVVPALAGDGIGDGFAEFVG